MECVQIKVTGSGTTVSFNLLLQTYSSFLKLTCDFAEFTCRCGNPRCLQRSRSRNCIQSIWIFHFLHCPWPSCLGWYQRGFRLCFSNCQLYFRRSGRQFYSGCCCFYQRSSCYPSSIIL
jgi:hypothetical protein